MATSSRKRTQRRADARTIVKGLRDREALARLEAGGAADHPIIVESASLVEPKARALPCIACGHEVRLMEHAAKTIDGAALRLAHTSCGRCGHDRTVYFAISKPLVN